jgi:hypothetical protein
MGLLTIFNSWQGRTFLFTTMFRVDLALLSLLLSSQYRVLFTGVKWPGYEANHLPPSSAKVNIVWCYTFTFMYVCMIMALS